MNYEQESDKSEIYAKALEMAQWLIGLNRPEYEYKIGQEETLAKRIFIEEMSRKKNGQESLFVRRGIIPDKSVPDQEEEDFWNVG